MSQYDSTFRLLEQAEARGVKQTSLNPRLHHEVNRAEFNAFQQRFGLGSMLSGHSEDEQRALTAVHEGAGHFSTALEQGDLVGAYAANAGQSAVLAAGGNRGSFEKNVSATMRRLVSGTAAISLFMDSKTPVINVEDRSDILAHAASYDSTISHVSHLRQEHFDAYRNDVQARMDEMRPNFSKYLSVAESIYNNPTWVSPQAAAQSSAVGAFAPGTTPGAMPKPVFESARDLLHSLGGEKKVEQFDSRYTGYDVNYLRNGLGPDSTPYDRWSASHVGNPIEAVRQLVTPSLDTQTRASRLGTGIANAFNQTNEKSGIWNSVAPGITDVRPGQAGRAVSQGSYGGLDFSYQRPLSTIDASGQSTAWKIQSIGKGTSSDADQYANLSAELHGHLVGANNWGVVQIDRDVYDNAIQSGADHDTALQAAFVSSRSGALGQPSSGLSSSLNSLTQIQAASQAANRSTGGIGPRIDSGASQGDMITHLDDQLRGIGGELGPDLSNQYFGMDVGQGIANPDVAQALYLNQQNAASVQASSVLAGQVGPAPANGNAAASPAAVTSMSASGSGIAIPPGSYPSSPYGGGLLHINNPPGSSPSMSATSGKIRIPTQQPYPSSQVPAAGVNIPAGAYPSSSVGSGNMGTGFPNVSPHVSGLGGSGGSGGSGVPASPIAAPSGGSGGTGGSGSFDPNKYHTEVAALGTAVGGLSKIFDDAAKSTDRLSGSQQSYIHHAENLTDVLSKAVSEAQKAGGPDATAFIQQVQAGGLGQLQGMLDHNLSDRASADYFRSPSPGSLNQVLSTFSQRGAGGRAAREDAEGNGWYGSSGVEKGLFKAAGWASAIPQDIINAHFQLRAISNDTLGPMSQDRSLYLAQQQQMAQQMAGSDFFGGYGYAGTDAFKQAYSTTSIDQQRQLALGHSAQRAVGGIANTLGGVAGQEGAADLQGLATSTVAGAQFGGIVGGPAGAMVGGAIGGGLFIAGQTANMATNPADRLNILAQGRGGAYRNSPIQAAEFDVAQLGRLAIANLTGDSATRQKMIAEADKGSQLQGLSSGDSKAFKASFDAMRTDPQLASVGLGLLKEQLKDTIGYLPDDVQNKILTDSMASFSGSSLADLKSHLQPLAQSASVGINLSGQGNMASLLRSAETGTSTQDYSSPGLSGYQKTVSAFLQGPNSSQRQALLPGVLQQQSDVASSYRQAGLNYTGDPLQVVRDTISASDAKLTPEQRASSQTKLSRRLQNEADRPGLSGQSGFFGAGYEGSDYDQWTQAISQDTTAEGNLRYQQAMRNRGTMGALNDQFRYGYGMDQGRARQLAGAIGQNTYQYDPNVARAAGQQAMLLGFGQAQNAGTEEGQLGAQAGNLGQLMTAGVSTSGFTGFGRYGFNTSGMIEQAKSALARNPMQGVNYGQNLDQAASMFSGWATYGGGTQGNMDLLGQISQLAPAKAQQAFAVLKGDPIANSQYVDQTGNDPWRRTVQTGSRGGSLGMQAGYDERIGSDQIARRQAYNAQQGYIQGDGAYSSSALMGMNSQQISAAQYQTQIATRNYDFSLAQRQLNRQESSMHTNWGFEDRGISLSRGQQDFGYQQQGQQLQLQGQQMQYNYQYQQQNRDIQFSHQQQESSWGIQNIEYQKNTSALQYGFNMIDADESVRYSTGRARRDAMRHRDEATVMQSVSQGQLNTEEDRAKTREKWASEQYTRDKTYADQIHQFDQRNFDLQKQNYEKNREFIVEQRKLEDDKRQFDRQIATIDIREAQESLKVHQQSQRTMDDLNAAQRVSNDLLTQANAQLNYMGQVGPQAVSSLQSFVDWIKRSISAMGSTPAPTGSGITPTPTGSGPMPTPTGGGITPSGGDGGSGWIPGPGYASGGYTGYGPKNKMVGGVHSGEYVIPQEGAPVLVDPEHVRLLGQILSVLVGISKGGNAIVNINQTNPALAQTQALSLLNRAYQ